MNCKTLFIGLFLIFFSVTAFPQIPITNGMSVGIEGGVIYPTFDESKSSYQPYGRAFLRFPFRIIELGIGYYKYADLEKGLGSYSTDMYSIDLKLGLANIQKNYTLQLYLLGISYSYCDKKMRPISYGMQTENKNSWVPAYVASVCYDANLNELLSFGLTVGLNLGNGYVLEPKDSTTNSFYFYLGTRISFGKNGYVQDSDNDGIRDSEEEEIYRTDPEKSDTDGDGINDYDEIFKYKTDPLKADTDGDGITDSDELFKYKTDPLNTDTDNDRISDYDEIFIYSTNPLNTDTDADGISDYDEIFKYKSNPLKGDTDGDGIRDRDEIFKYKTDPLKADTDGDGITDYNEIFKFKTDPLKADTDSDGINDYDEIFTYFTKPLKSDSDYDGINDYSEIFTYKTNPNKGDSDDDGINDYDEVFKYFSNPLSADSDNDGLSDYQEIFVYHTNPLLLDSDSSGVDDKTEIERGTDPTDSEDDVITIDKAIILEGIEFEFKKATITPESDMRLQKTLKLLQVFPDYTFSIEGHTDDVGSKQFNQKLSLARAKEVKTWLVNHGIDADRLTVKGYGFDRPIATNTTEEGRQRNRRVEFIRTR
jgi:outer membrane protein OmpA-like peptidoglycan-associated protein